MDKTHEENEIFECSDCGAEFDKDAKVCPKCGAKFETEFKPWSKLKYFLYAILLIPTLYGFYLTFRDNINILISVIAAILIVSLISFRKRDKSKESKKK